MGSFIYLDDFLKEHVKNGPAGCGCAVVQNDELLYEGYYGYADLEKRNNYAGHCLPAVFND